MMHDDRLASMLSTARDVLRGELQPALDTSQRYRAAMVASAIAIAARALGGGADVAMRQLQALAALYPDAQGIEPSRIEHRLARELRQCRLDVDREERVRAVLLARTLARLEIANPDYPSTFSRSQAP